MRVLVLNAGSSSLKASILDGDRVRSAASATWSGSPRAFRERAAVVRAVIAELELDGPGLDTVDAVGHRIVHGGARFTGPVVLDDAAMDVIEDLAELAPLHNRVARDTISVARHHLPEVPHVGAFDTAFHRTIAMPRRLYPVPRAWESEWGIQRFGFHGLSVEWSVRQAGRLLRRRVERLGIVVAHLGSGCSVTAVDAGRSADTSMGFTPLEGLMMATRSGSIDPGVLLHLLRGRRLTIGALTDALEHGSGLLGVSGVSADMRQCLAAEREGHPGATLAVEMFVARTTAAIAAVATALPRLDALVFTGGIGEHAAAVRRRIAVGLGVLGFRSHLAVDAPGDAILDRPRGRPAVLRIEAREDLVIARQVTDLLVSPG